jgi:hypothetical protein
MTAQEWELEQQLGAVLPLGESELNQILVYIATLPDPEAAAHLKDLLGESPEASNFIASYNEYRMSNKTEGVNGNANDHHSTAEKMPVTSQNPPSYDKGISTNDADTHVVNTANDIKHSQSVSAFCADPSQPRSYAPPSGPPPEFSRAAARRHTNLVIEAARVRAQDEVLLLTTPRQEIRRLTHNSKRCSRCYKISSSSIEYTILRSSRNMIQIIHATVQFINISTQNGIVFEYRRCGQRL